MRHRAKYEEQINGWNIVDVSQVRNGLVMDRQATDCLWCGIFAIFVIIWLGIDIYAMANQEILKMVGPMDGDHKVCGTTFNQTSNYGTHPYLYFSDLGAANLDNLFDSAVCVDRCP